MPKTESKYVVITSISSPTKAVRDIAKMDDWKLIVIGDKKSPAKWRYPNVDFLSIDNQLNSGYKLAKLLPWNHYGRKIIGYLSAIQNGADIIWDTDDDNIPLSNFYTPKFNGNFKTLSNKRFINTYNYFTNNFVWPRGLPLNWILDSKRPKESTLQSKIGVWQFLADEDPDVDAIYRLVNGKFVYFKKKSPIVLGKGSLSPFNSQNTFFRKELFPLLYLPGYVTFRFTDILRSFVAQPIMWLYGYKLGFGPATVIQKRNPHDYMEDFRSEVPVYLDGERTVEIVESAVKKENTVTINLLLAYQALAKEGIVTSQELRLLDAWVSDLKKIGQV